MSIDDYDEKDVTDMDSIKAFIESIKSQQRELILTSSGETVGAIITAEQYEWFLDQLDAQQDIGFVDERAKDLEGSQSLDEFKKELGE